MDSSERCKTFSNKHLCNWTTSRACCRRERPLNISAAFGLGWCSKKARLAVTARIAFPARPASRRIAVAWAESRQEWISSMSKNARAALRKASSENDDKPCTTRWVGRMSTAGLFMLTKVIIMNSYGESLGAEFGREE